LFADATIFICVGISSIKREREREGERERERAINRLVRRRYHIYMCRYFINKERERERGRERERVLRVKLLRNGNEIKMPCLNVYLFG